MRLHFLVWDDEVVGTTERCFTLLKLLLYSKLSREFYLCKVIDLNNDTVAPSTTLEVEVKLMSLTIIGESKVLNTGYTTAVV